MHMSTVLQPHAKELHCVTRFRRFEHPEAGGLVLTLSPAWTTALRRRAGITIHALPSPRGLGTIPDSTAINDRLVHSLASLVQARQAY